MVLRRSRRLASRWRRDKSTRSERRRRLAPHAAAVARPPDGQGPLRITSPVSIPSSMCGR
jgi:hypothetical protein